MYPRGFKAWCENVAIALRVDIGLDETSPIDPVLLAAHLTVALRSPDDIPGIPQSSTRVLTEQNDGWSAVTVSHEGRTCIVYNPHHSSGRNSSDIMHELSHILLKHDAARVFFSEDTSIALRTFDNDQEDQANWLAGCLLLPRPALLWILRNRIDTDEACAHFRVSAELLRYRLDITGVKLQMRRRRAVTRGDRT